MLGARGDASSLTTHYKPTGIFQNTHYSFCHSPGVKRGFIKGKGIRLHRTNPSENNFQEAMCNFKTRLEARGYPKSLTDITISEVSFAGRQSALKKKQTKQTKGKIYAFCDDIPCRCKKLKTKQILMQKCFQSSQLIRLFACFFVQFLHDSSRLLRAL